MTTSTPAAQSAPPKSTTREYFESIVIAVILALFVRTWCFQAFKIPTGSMENNLLIGDHLVVNKFLFAPAGPERALLPIRDYRRGDVVVFKSPEDPERDFRPSPGMITSFHAPGGYGVRLDSHVYTGYSIPPYYDSMVGKLIVTGADRREAIERMRGALDELTIEGIKTTIPFHKMLMRNEQFIAGDFDTHFLEHFDWKSAMAKH